MELLEREAEKEVLKAYCRAFEWSSSKDEVNISSVEKTEGGTGLGGA